MEWMGRMTERMQRRLLFAAAAAVGIAMVALIVFRPGEQASAGVDLNDPNAWIEHGLDGQLLQINGVTGEVTARIEVSEPGDMIRAVPHGYGAVVLNQTSGAVSLVNGSSLDVTSTTPLELTDGAAQRDLEVFGSEEPSGNVVIVDDDQLLIVDPQSRIVTPILFDEPLLDVAQTVDGSVLALPSDAQSVQSLGTRSLDELIQLGAPVGNTADERSLVRAGGSIWFVDPDRLSMSEIGPGDSFGPPTCMTSAASGAITGGSSDGDDALILAYNPVSALLGVSDPVRGTCTEIQLDLDSRIFGAPIANKGLAYLPNWGDGRIEVIDLVRERAIASLPFGTNGKPFELDVRGSIVWANEPLGPFAAVVNEFGLLPVAKLAAIVAGAVEIDAAGDGETLTGADIDRSGLRIIGDSGAEVIALRSDGNGGSGSGSGSGSDEAASLDALEAAAAPELEAVGISIQGPREQDEQLTPEVAATLIANFGVSAATAKVDEVLRFTDFSSGSPTSWTWDFGDGTGSIEPNTEKSWGTEGVYEVELTVTNARGDQSSLSTEVTIVAKTVLIPPTADFTFDRSILEEGESVSFQSITSGDADLLEWDFGDGGTEIGPSVSHQFEIAGLYIVTLTASNPAGSTSVSTPITVLAGVDPPQAVIGALPVNVVNGQFVTLRSASLNEPTRHSWDLGDGSRGSGRSVQHAWEKPGTYRIRLTVENSKGTDSTFVDIAVAKRVDPPISQFTQSATEVLVGETVTFTDLSLNQPTRLIWGFGDDTTARGSTASKSWSRPGTYRVTLRATNDAGTNRSGVTIKVVEPVDPPFASFTASPTIVAPNQPVSFQDTSSNNPTSWSWDFGDTGSSAIPNTTHVYSGEGTYLVRLTVRNEGGSSTTEQVVTVKRPPSANFRWVSDGRRVKFTDTSWDDPQEWSWDFGDGATSTNRSPTHRFESDGSFIVTLTVSNAAGSSAPKTQTVAVGDPPVANFSCKAEGPRLRCDAGSSKNAVSYRWTSADAISNTTPNQQTTTLTYGSEGRYRVTLRVENEAGVTDEKTIRGPRVTQGRAPRIQNVAVDNRQGDLVRLDADFDRSPTTWEWSVEGAELVEGGNTSRPLFRVPRNGVYDGTVRASNEFGADSVGFSFTMDTIETTASFEWSVVAPGIVQFTNTSDARVDAKYQWRFAGSVEVLDNDPNGPTVQYPDTGGTFLVILVATDANGTDIARRNIEVPGNGP